jgi:hypothetical protein
MEESHPEENILFNLSLSVDRDNYFRRTCGVCGRDFKTQYNESDLAWAIAPQIQRLGLEIGGSTSAKDEEIDYFFCPYCGDRGESSDMLSDEISQYIKRHLMREFVLPITNKMFSGFENTGTKKGGFLSIEFKFNKSLYPPRPIHGPEPADMKIIDFLCCNKRAKISEKWNLVDKCIFCGTDVNLI